MFVISNFLGALAQVLGMVIHIYIWVIIIQALISWVNPDPHNPIVRFLYAVTEPVLRPARRLLFQFFPSLFGGTGIDFSPFIVILVLFFINSFIVGTLSDLAVRLK
jgi:YggT family protein